MNHSFDEARAMNGAPGASYGRIRSMSDASDPSIWKIIFLSGCGLIAACFGALCSYTIFTNVVGDHLELGFSAIGAGLVCLIVGAIGWAIKLGRQKSKRLALMLSSCLWGYVFWLF